MRDLFGSEAIGRMKVIDGHLYVPAIDPAHQRVAVTSVFDVDDPRTVFLRDIVGTVRAAVVSDDDFAREICAR